MTQPDYIARGGDLVMAPPLELNGAIMYSFLVAAEIPALPSLRDPDLLVYCRQEVDGLIMGGYERQPAPFALDTDGRDAIPLDFNGRLLAADWSRMEEIGHNAARRVPVCMGR